MKLTRKQALEILTTDEVYQAMNLDKYYSDENEACPSVYDVLGVIGIDHKEVDEVLGKEF